jgi:hypothetical protein
MITMACAHTHRQYMVECDDTARNKLYTECAAATLVSVDAVQHVHITQAVSNADYPTRSS